MRRSHVALIGAVFLVVGGWGLRRALAPPPSDEALIRALFTEAAQALAERRVGDTMEAVSEGFQGEGLDKRGVHRVLAAFSLRGEWVGVSVTGDRIAVSGDSADAVVDVVAARGGEGKGLAELLPADANAHRLTCQLRREDGRWRIVSARRRAIGLGEAIEGPEAAEP